LLQLDAALQQYANDVQGYVPAATPVDFGCAQQNADQGHHARNKRKQ
jgi:hypothetical protein